MSGIIRNRIKKNKLYGTFLLGIYCYNYIITLSQMLTQHASVSESWSEEPDSCVFPPTHHLVCVFMYRGHNVGAMIVFIHSTHACMHVCMQAHTCTDDLWKPSSYITIFKGTGLLVFHTFFLKCSSWLCLH